MAKDKRRIPKIPSFMAFFPACKGGQPVGKFPMINKIIFGSLRNFYIYFVASSRRPETVCTWKEHYAVRTKTISFEGGSKTTLFALRKNALKDNKTIDPALSWKTVSFVRQFFLRKIFFIHKPMVSSSLSSLHFNINYWEKPCNNAQRSFGSLSEDDGEKNQD